MKNLILITLFISPVLAFGQIDKSDPCNRLTSILFGNIAVDDCNSEYLFLYKDSQYQQLSNYESFPIIKTDSALSAFRGAMIDGFNSDQEIKITLPNNDVVLLDYNESMGIKSVRFIHYPGGSDIYSTSAYLTEKQVNKLFSKIR